MSIASEMKEKATDYDLIAFSENDGYLGNAAVDLSAAAAEIERLENALREIEQMPTAHSVIRRKVIETLGGER